jgi:hypothetical protein
MEKKLIFIIGLYLSIIICFHPLQGHAESPQPVTLNQLVEEGAKYDGKTVIVTGEALVELLERGEDAWVNINDGTNAMGVFMPLEDAKKIKTFGEYHTVGDKIEIEAVFNRSCKVHGGDMELHFIKYKNMTPGQDRVTQINKQNLLLAIGLTAITIFMTFYYMSVSGQFKRMAKGIEHFKQRK